MSRSGVFIMLKLDVYESRILFIDVSLSKQLQFLVNLIFNDNNVDNTYLEKICRHFLGAILKVDHQSKVDIDSWRRQSNVDIDQPFSST